ncbi:MAG TPA: sensor domain-containing protein [Streptosporangiaceae bacterium]|nr:sensor domain-containing protein [Streptosporangiaceae bacterium]
MMRGPRLREGLVAAGRGVALTGLILAEAGVLLALAIGVTLAALGSGLLLIPRTLLAGRGLTSGIRRLAGSWSGVPIAVPYRPQPTGDAARRGLWRRLAWLLTDQATWRDLLWMTVDCLVGWVLTLAPVSLMAGGLFGVVMPAVWAPIVHAGGNNWYAFIHITGTTTAWLAVPLGVAFVAIGLWSGPRLLTAHGGLARSLLAPAADLPGQPAPA